MVKEAILEATDYEKVLLADCVRALEEKKAKSRRKGSNVFRLTAPQVDTACLILFGHLDRKLTIC